MSELYQLPDGWEWKKLGNVLKLRSGNFLPKREMVLNGKFNVYGGNGINGTHNEFNLSGENILIGRVGALCGNVRYVCDSIWVTDNAFFVSEYLEDIDKNFLTRLLSFIELGKFANKAAQPVLSYSGLCNILLPIPPLTEQKRIVQKLDALFERIDKAIALLQKNIDAADNFMNSVLNDVFSNLEQNYQKKSLCEVVRIIGGGTPSKEVKEYWNGGDIKWATVGDMNTETIVDTELMITNSGLNNSSSNIVSKHGIVIATRVGLGKVCYLYQDTAINQDLKGLIPLDVNLLNIRYLYNYFKYMKDYIIRNGTGATVKGVKLDFIKSLKLPLPDSLLQQKAVIYLDSISATIEQVKSTQQKKMQNLLDLKSSILDQAFHGKL